MQEFFVKETMGSLHRELLVKSFELILQSGIDFCQRPMQAHAVNRLRFAQIDSRVIIGSIYESREIAIHCFAFIFIRKRQVNGANINSIFLQAEESAMSERAARLNRSKSMSGRMINELLVNSISFGYKMTMTIVTGNFCGQ